MRIIRTLVVVIALLGFVALSSEPAGAQDPPDCLGCPTAGGVGDNGGSVFAVVGQGGTILVGGAGDGCTYWLDGLGENYFSFEPMSWEPISATATDGGITATTTATPLRVEWDTGNLIRML